MHEIDRAPLEQLMVKHFDRGTGPDAETGEFDLAELVKPGSIA